MPLRDLKGYLWDVTEACNKIERFSSGKTLEDYLSDELLRSAIERQLIIVGEALAQARQFFPQVNEQLSYVAQIVGFRNRVIHDYLEISDVTVWDIVQTFIPQLKNEAQTLLGQGEL
jgi:uncharacterized protein with HEPN domain